MSKNPHILVATTQLQFFIKISRTEFPGNQVINLISRDSEFSTESESLIGKISTGQKSAPRNSAYSYFQPSKMKQAQTPTEMRLLMDSDNYFI